MNKKGMTIVELIVSFALTIVIALFLTEIVLFLKNTYVNNGIKTEIVSKQTLISDRIYSLLGSKRIIQAKDCDGKCVELTFDDGTYSQIAFNNNKAVIGDYVTELPSSCIVGNVTAGTESFDNNDNYNSIFQIYVPITSSVIKNKNFDINLVYQYNNNEENWTYNENKNSYRLVIPNVEIVSKDSDFNLLDGVRLVDNNNNTIDVEIKYESKPSFNISSQGKYEINYFTFYAGKTYISTKTIRVVKGDFSYTGGVQEFVAPANGWYQVELWGAEGGDASDSVTVIGGKGGYTSGKIYLNRNDTLSIYVGGMGSSYNNNELAEGGYNSGGNGYAGADKYVGGGGGTTDIRFNGNSLKDRIMVGGGGGGSVYQSNGPYIANGGNAGGLIGTSGAMCNSSTPSGGGGTQINGGTNGGTVGNPTIANFGLGASVSDNGSPGGGGGYYGGGIAYYVSGGGGGSSFISGYAGVNAITSSSSLTPTNNTIHYSGKYFIDGEMQAGVNSGNGKAKITYLSETKPQRVSTKLNNVRYIKDCARGSSYSGHVGWVELQAIKDGINVAKGKTVTGTEIDAVNGVYDKVVDGDISTDNYDGTTSSSGTYCITVNLNQAYDLDEIAIWHYWGDGRSYHDNVISVSSDNTNWTVVMNYDGIAETSNGKRVNAYSNDFKFVRNYAHTGNTQTFTAPVDGYYKLEVWGAQGGSDGANGGYGGYSTGMIHLQSNQSIYINVGNYGNSGSGIGGGYNGGGNAGSSGLSGAGGGATHIATTNRGGLSNYSSYKDEVLIVAGGGGGDGAGVGGGSGGGFTGNSSGGSAGTQSSGCSFGQGCTSSADVGGGGGGWYGGNAGNAGGGGSGYVGNENLYNGEMYCYNCASSGGYKTKTLNTTNVSETAVSEYAKIGPGTARINYIGQTIEVN